MGIGSPGDEPFGGIKPVLYSIGGKIPLPEGFPSSGFSFHIRSASHLSFKPDLLSAFLVLFPAQAAITAHLPRTSRFIAYGPSEWMSDAFARGSADYIVTPLEPNEFIVRVERVLGSMRRMPVPGTDMFLSGQLLSGLKEAALLRQEDALVLRILLSRYPEQVSRSALKSCIWPELPDTSRVVDAAVSRLRAALSRVQEGKRVVQVYAIRGFGYKIILPETC
ncbi:winged helix-turn-helix domain-containing protein [Treponema sp. OttesenSCG-928-L16]|nr:winged helix-turn-helix domain-containing protein [Treponema sp. OttesenSCG-928-L16]